MDGHAALLREMVEAVESAREIALQGNFEGALINLQAVLKETQEVILHLVATGSIFKKWQEFTKRNLRNSIIPLLQPSAIEGEPCLPIAEMICNDHTTEIISRMLFSLDCNRL